MKLKLTRILIRVASTESIVPLFRDQILAMRTCIRKFLKHPAKTLLVRDPTGEWGRGGYTYTLSSTFCWLNVSALNLGGFSEVPCVVRYITSSFQRADSKNVNCHPHCFRSPRKRWHFHAIWKRSRGRCVEGLFVNQMLWVFLNSLWRHGVFTERVRKHPKLFPSAILKGRECSHGLS